jgi:hypothetical protein
MKKAQMHKFGGHRFLLLLFTVAISILSCDKNSTYEDPAGGNAGYKLSYGDSVLYLSSQAGDRYVSPLQPKPGVYSSFPEGLAIDPATGTINVTQSETGLRYRVTHTATDGTVTNTMIVISGINYSDKFYKLGTDSICYPVYNANPTKILPLSGSLFDVTGEANNSGCEVATTNGQINLAKSIREGLFGNNPGNDDKIEVDVIYKLNDPSGKATNRIRVKLYYYTSMATVTSEMIQTLQEREEQGVFLRAGLDETLSPGEIATQQAGMISAKAVARPRPPCIVIIAN